MRVGCSIIAIIRCTALGAGQSYRHRGHSRVYLWYSRQMQLNSFQWFIIWLVLFVIANRHHLVHTVTLGYYNTWLSGWLAVFQPAITSWLAVHAGIWPPNKAPLNWFLCIIPSTPSASQCQPAHFQTIPLLLPVSLPRENSKIRFASWDVMWGMKVHNSTRSSMSWTCFD